MTNYHNHADKDDGSTVALTPRSCRISVNYSVEYFYLHEHAAVIKFISPDFGGHSSIWEYSDSTEQKSHNL